MGAPGNGVGWDVVGTEVGRRDNVGSAVGVIVESVVGVNVGSAVDEATVGVNDKGCFVGFNVGFFDGIRLEGVLEEDIEGKLVGFRVFMVGILVGSAVGSLVGTTEGLEEEGDAVEGLRVGRTLMGALEVGVLDGFIDTGRFDDGVHDGKYDGLLVGKYDGK